MWTEETAVLAQSGFRWTQKQAGGECRRTSATQRDSEKLCFELRDKVDRRPTDSDRMIHRKSRKLIHKVIKVCYTIFQ